MKSLENLEKVESKMSNYLRLAHKIKSGIVMQRPLGRGVVATIKEVVRQDDFFKRCQVFTFGYDDLTQTFGVDSEGKVFVKGKGDLGGQKYFAWYALANVEPSVLIFDNVEKASKEELELVKALIIDAHRQENIAFSKDTLLIFSETEGSECLDSYYVERSCNMTPLLQELNLVD